MRWAGHVARMGEEREVHRVPVCSAVPQPLRHRVPQQQEYQEYFLG
jgi:hypothetical protein